MGVCGVVRSFVVCIVGGCLDCFPLGWWAGWL